MTDANGQVSSLDVSEHFRTMLEAAVKTVLTEVLSSSMRPAVIASDSGVSSVTRERMSDGTPKVTVKVYHEDPDKADILCALLYDRAMAWRQDHPAGAQYPPYEIEKP